MALTSDELLHYADFHDAVRMQTTRLMAASKSETRLATAFSNQQRWLMSHVGLSLFFQHARNQDAPGLNITTFTDEISRLGIASRNTADAYVKELINYGYLLLVETDSDRRSKPLRPTPTVTGLYTMWTAAHLQTLDHFQPRRRTEWFMRDPTVLSRLQPIIAHRLVERRGFRALGDGFSLLNWLDAGAHLLDILTINAAPDPQRPDYIICAPTPTVEIAAQLNISRPHLSRKLREAEGRGVMGWTGLPGKSALWVGPQFLSDYYFGQAVKLAAIDEAWERLQ